MRKMHLFNVGILAFLCIEIGSGAPIEALTTEKLKQIMTTVPETERSDFIKINIYLGYTIEQLHKHVSLENGELAVQIFHYFVKNQEAIRKKKAAMSLINTINMCFPEPVGCIDPDDPGIRPGIGFVL